MWPTPLPAATSPFEVVLINPYELGRQPFGLAEPVPTLSADLGSAIPRLSEPWYCCAEPTDQQLQSF